MNHSATNQVLDAVVRREGRSLLQYVGEAFPWTTAQGREALGRLRKLIDEERETAAKLSEFLARRRHRFPTLKPFPAEFTNINYVSLEHLLPMLVEDGQRALAALERDLAALDDPEAEQQIQAMVGMKRRHLAALESLAAESPQTLSTVR